MTEAEAAAWRVLMDREQSRLNQVIDAFWEWCTPEKLLQIREGFHEILKNSVRSREIDLVSATDDSTESST
jgi:hypothetical protein